MSWWRIWRNYWPLWWQNMSSQNSSFEALWLIFKYLTKCLEIWKCLEMPRLEKTILNLSPKEAIWGACIGSTTILFSEWEIWAWSKDENIIKFLANLLLKETNYVRLVLGGGNIAFCLRRYNRKKTERKILYIIC